MPIDWAPFVDLVGRHQRFLLTTHVRPDGDGLGSQLALGEVLEQQGKQVRHVNASMFPPRYDFLDPHKRVERFNLPGDAWRQVDAVIVVDTGTWNQLGDLAPFCRRWPSPRPSSITTFRRTTSARSLWWTRPPRRPADWCSRPSRPWACRCPRPPPTTCLSLWRWTPAGSVTRTRRRRPSPWPRSSRVPAPNPRRSMKNFSSSSTLPRLKLTGVVLDRMQVVEQGRVAYTEIRRQDYEATGAVPQDSEDLINYPRSIAGVEVGLLFMEQPAGGVKISFRSKDKVNVEALAKQFGGGGHRLASGAIAAGSLEEVRTRVLEAVRAAL